MRQSGSRPTVLPWTELAHAAYTEFKLSPLRQYRANATLQTAMVDAVIAAYDAQEAYTSPRPAELDSQITPLEGITADRPRASSETAISSSRRRGLGEPSMAYSQAGRLGNGPQSTATGAGA